MNGRTQEYHESNVLQGGFSSPLLDVLNARFLVVPAEAPPGRPDLLHLGQRFPTVHTDDQVRVLENREALPRAWIVHDARQVPEGEAVALMTSGQIDISKVAVLESAPPALAAPADESADSVTVLTHTPDEIDLTTRTDAPGMVVLSEVYDPGWKASVDGEEVPLVLADHVLRAVAVPAGEHTLELRYESRPLRLGLVLSGLTALAMLGIALALALRRFRLARTQ